MYWYLEALKNYAVFSGRARRREYWFFMLFNVIIMVALTIIDYLIGSLGVVSGLGILGSLYTLAVFIPELAVSVRRLHDINKSGWWLLISFIPFIGSVVLLIFFFQDGTAGNNNFGQSPKTVLS